MSGEPKTVPVLNPRPSATEVLAPVESSTATDAAHAASPSRGATSLPLIPGYRLVRRLGGGGMGEVFEVIDERLDLRFALKVIRPDRSSYSFQERFRQEIKAMMLLDHPHVARIYGHSETNGSPYFTMEFAPGGTLTDRREDFQSDPRAAAHMVAKVADAVDYLHRQGKVHRDLKPSNILFDSDREPIVSDFGLVKDLIDLDADALRFMSPAAASTPIDGLDNRTSQPSPGVPGGVTRTGGVVGTAAYMSPEQARGDRGAVGPSADIWAIGVILYELLAGHRPADAADPANPLADLELIDAGLVRIVGRCLATDPANRYSSAAELASDLRHWADPVASPPEPARPRRGRQIALVLAAIALAGITIVLAMRPWARDRQKPGPTIEQLREEIRGQLANGETVTLIDAEGNATPIVRLVFGESLSKFGRDPGGWWGLHSPDVVLAEFLDDPGVPSFTLAADVRGQFTNGLPMAGLYVGHRRIEEAGGPWDFLIEYRFRESKANHLMGGGNGGKGIILGPPVPYESRMVRLHGMRQSDGGSSPHTVYTNLMERNQPTVGGPWRSMEIRMDNSGFAASWDGNLEYSTPEFPLQALIDVQVFLKDRPDPPLTFSARGGVGLYVESGSAAFRNLRLIPGKPQ